jgi:hypothetical protein
MKGDWFVLALIGQYLIAACAYGVEGQGWKSLYWIGAMLISVAVLKLR